MVHPLRPVVQMEPLHSRLMAALRPSFRHQLCLWMLLHPSGHQDHRLRLPAPDVISCLQRGLGFTRLVLSQRTAKPPVSNRLSGDALPRHWKHVLKI